MELTVEGNCEYDTATAVIARDKAGLLMESRRLIEKPEPLTESDVQRWHELCEGIELCTAQLNQLFEKDRATHA